MHSSSNEPKHKINKIVFLTFTLKYEAATSVSETGHPLAAQVSGKIHEVSIDDRFVIRMCLQFL